MCGMSMDKKLFAVADIHGHFTELKKALDASGFENGNPENLLIVCGDLFDHSRTFDDHSIFYGDGMIAIDGGTVRSGIVNVLVIEPEENCRR